LARRRAKQGHCLSRSQRAKSPPSGSIASALGIAILFFGVLGVAGEVRSGLNQIWVTENPSPSRGVSIVRDKSVAIAMVLSMVLLLTLSLLVSTALVGTGRILATAFRPLPGIMVDAANLAFSASIASLLFALMFRFVPATRPSWRDVTLGAFLTGSLFAAGKALMNRYVVISDSMSADTAVGSLIVITLWVYYSTQVFFFGAEFTHQYEEFRKKCGLEPVKRSNPFHLSVAVDKVRSKPRRSVPY
jgi:membrane protein